MESVTGPALRPPPPGLDLTAFPTWDLPGTRQLRRAHRTTNSPWWFSSSGTGRFDLSAPRGTCYLALTVIAALREVVRADILASKVITADFADKRSVSTLTCPTARKLANTGSARAANFGLTLEISTLDDYVVPQRWAQAFDAHGVGGIRYQTRFSTGADAQGVALFGQAGAATWAPDPAPMSLRDAATRAGLTVAGRPTSVRIVTPPAP